jgi:Holliday junction resolvase RusA-like endonuclease
VEHRIRFEVVGRPATFATAAERPWKEAVRAAVRAAGITPTTARWGVRIEFRTPVPVRRNDVWDIDNLIKPTLDAMEGVLGSRVWNGPPQCADDCVDYVEASKRTVQPGEEAGAVIEAWTIPPP